MRPYPPALTALVGLTLLIPGCADTPHPDDAPAVSEWSDSVVCRTLGYAGGAVGVYAIGPESRQVSLEHLAVGTVGADLATSGLVRIGKPLVAAAFNGAEHEWLHIDPEGGEATWSGVTTSAQAIGADDYQLVTHDPSGGLARYASYPGLLLDQAVSVVAAPIDTKPFTIGHDLAYAVDVPSGDVTVFDARHGTEDVEASFSSDAGLTAGLSVKGNSLYLLDLLSNTCGDEAELLVFDRLTGTLHDAMCLTGLVQPSGGLVCESPDEPEG